MATRWQRTVQPALSQAWRDANVLWNGLHGRWPSPVVQRPGRAPQSSRSNGPRVDPPGIRGRARRLRRDIGVVWNGLHGRWPSPLVERPPRRTQDEGRAAAAQSAAAATLGGRAIRITRVVQETPNAVSLYLADPDGEPLEFVPGQFLTVLVDVGGETLRRAYSLASAALPGHEPHVTVKRIGDGRVSNYLNDSAEEGQMLHVLGPSGQFTVDPSPDTERHLVMIAGGSGITPIMSITHSVLSTEPNSRVTLIYGNRSWDEIIFRDRLDALASEHEGRLTIDHVLEDPPASWSGGVGRLDRATVEQRFDTLGVLGDPSIEYFVCGPSPVLAATHEALADRRVPAERIHEERFTSPEQRQATSGASNEPQPLTVRAQGRDHQLVVDPGGTVLETGLSSGVTMPFSCTMGGCGSCRVKLTEGEVDMEEPNCLRPDEREAGYILACVSRPRTPVKVEVES